MKWTIYQLSELNACLKIGHAIEINRVGEMFAVTGYVNVRTERYLQNAVTYIRRGHEVKFPPYSH